MALSNRSWQRVRDDRPAFDRLIEAARLGSSEALGQLLEAYATCLRITADWELPPRVQARISSSDLVQETFLEAARNFPRFQGHSQHEFLAWLRRILLHNLADARRSERRRTARHECSLDELLSRSDSPMQLEADDTSPSGSAMAREEEERVRQALAELPEDYLTVIMLHFRDGVPFDEVACRMGRSVDAVRKLWVRGLKQLHDDVKRLREDQTPARTAPPVS